MAAAEYIKVNGVARQVKNQYINVGGVSKKVKKGWIMTGGNTKQFFSVPEYKVNKSNVTLTVSGSTGTSEIGKLTYSGVPSDWSSVGGTVVIPASTIQLYDQYGRLRDMILDQQTLRIPEKSKGSYSYVSYRQDYSGTIGGNFGSKFEDLYAILYIYDTYMIVQIGCRYYRENEGNYRTVFGSLKTLTSVDLTFS